MDAPIASDVGAAQGTPSAPSQSAQEITPSSRSQPKPVPISAAKPSYTHSAAVSPSLLRSSSPRLNSPASSEIFERNVQEPIPISTLEGEPRAHLATHVITEDLIPPALEASAQAITSRDLNPDEVEIVTSSSHQTAAASVLESATGQLDLASLHSPQLSQKADDSESVSQSGLLPPPPHMEEDLTTTYGSIDPNDVRRLSFISFADVVQSEHQHPAASISGDNPSRETNFHNTALSSWVPATAPTGQAQAQVQASSPLRSPPAPAGQISGGAGLTTPPLPAARAIAGAEQSPSRNLAPGNVHSELTIETMRQIVRKTASGDIGQNFRTPGLSPVLSNDDLNGLRSRTNT